MFRSILILLVALAIVGSVVVAGTWYLLTQRVEGRYFESADIRLHYTDEGAGEVVILLHGFAVNSDLNWRRSGILDELSERFRVVALDLRGHGLSDKPHALEAYGLALVSDVKRLVDHLGLERVHLVGYSLGGFIALKLAALNPASVQSTVLIGAGWESPDNSAFFAAIPRLQQRLTQGHSIGPLSEYLGGGREAPSLLHAGSVHLMTGYFNDPYALAAMLGSLPQLTVTEAELRAIRGPVLAIVGQHDPFRTGAAALCGRLGDFRMVVVDGTDHVRLAFKDETIASLQQFLDEPERVADGCSFVLH
jgi:pimeloyl-ACP methyl ester carboxylesterase